MGLSMSPRTYHRVTVAALASLCVIVETGALVRLTGSGLGCEDWPNCNDERFVDVSTAHGAIEQVNRLFTGVVAVAVVLAVLGSLWRRPRRRDLTWLSLGLVGGVLGQIVLGGIVVLTGLNPVANQGHFLLSMVLVANGLVLVLRAGEPDGATRRDATSAAARLTAWAVLCLTAVALVTGTVVTGAGPHAGDEDAPRLDVAIDDVARIHAIAVILTVVAALGLAWILRTRPRDRRVLQGALTLFLVVAIAQGLVGYVQYFGGVPVALVAIHVAGATAVWLAAIVLVDRCRTTSVVADHPSRVDDPVATSA
jgi:cytochrome c oxidase assembly protein subunit 15